MSTATEEQSHEEVRGVARYFPSWQAMVLAVVGYFFFGTLAWYGWLSYRTYAVPGFDTGIFTQGAYLLSRLQEPFVTLRGLEIFGDHSSFILTLFAPAFWLAPDPRVLLIAQAAAVTVPAFVTYALAKEKFSRTVALGLALAYFTMPAAQWVSIFHFHPEGLATAFLSLAVWAFFRRRGGWLFLFLLLAMLCKEDVSFVIFGFGIVMFIEGRKRWGLATALFSMGYFIMATFVAMPLINGRNNLYFQRNYGVEVEGFTALLSALPTVLVNGLENLAAEEGLLYLALLLGPVLFLPLLRGRWLIPILPPLILNFASLIPYQHEIGFQYLATSVPFIIIAAMEGLKQIEKFRRVGPVLAAALAVAVTLTWFHGPVDRLQATYRTAQNDFSTQREMLALIPTSAPVAATHNYVVHLINRTYVYEFPNPYKVRNWGFGNDEIRNPADVERIEYLALDTNVLDNDGKAVYQTLRKSPNWTVVYERDNVVLLSKTALTPTYSQSLRTERDALAVTPTIAPTLVIPPS